MKSSEYPLPLHKLGKRARKTRGGSKKKLEKLQRPTLLVGELTSRFLQKRLFSRSVLTCLHLTLRVFSLHLNFSALKGLHFYSFLVILLSWECLEVKPVSGGLSLHIIFFSSEIGCHLKNQSCKKIHLLLGNKTIKKLDSCKAETPSLPSQFYCKTSFL